ncbi:ATP-binding protein [Muricoccus pecuniae]|uniref:histidine kinase n=1 Tax=Muricoccus pecuniae TaxID=693023 RepID=A0A840XZN4_9PROT|nr:ATP-binding protein [Roseomonas pecuniae]MBB5693336.1 two-component system cell cycle sensor histidine kinase/response regulator CckA [Roseomonas pecuniae]
MANGIRQVLGFGAARRVDGVEAGLAALLDALPQGAALLDSSDAVLRANEPLRAMLGPLQPLRPGMAVLSLFDPAAREAVRAWMGEEGPGWLEAGLAAPEGRAPVPASLHLAVLPEGRRALLVTDLSEQRRRREEAEAGEKLRAIGQLAGGIAHDVNNLLAIIMGAMDAAVSAAPRAAEALAPAQDAAARGAALVRRLLAFARRQQLEPRVLDLDEAVAAARPMLRSLLGSRIALEWRPGALGRRVRVDPVQLDQVLLNLVANARDAMGGEGRVTIATDTAVALGEEPGLPDALPPGRWTVLEVTDTGPGIPPEIIGHVFEPFFTTRAGQGGTGLGLATVHGVVRQSGGALQVESRPGLTRFRIFLPRHDGKAGEEPAPAPAAAPVATRNEAGRHILLVDDEAPLRRLTAVALERAGHRVTQAEGGEEALELIEEGLEPGAVISDISMPGLDGLALARAVRDRRPGLPVVLVSGYAEAALGEDLGRDGILFLAKPFRPAQLVELVSGLPLGERT